MAFKMLDRVKMSVTGVPGTGDVTVSAPLSGYQSLAQAGLTDGDTFAYSMVEGNNWEYGVGSYTSAGTMFSRTTTKTSAQNADPINFSSKVVITAVLRAEDLGGGKLSGLTDVTINPATTTDQAPLVWNASGQDWVAGPLSNLTVVIANSFFPVDGTSWPNINVLDFNSTDFAIDPPAGGVAKVRLASSGGTLGLVEVRNNYSLAGVFNSLNFINPTSIVPNSSAPEMANITLPTGGGASTLATLTDVNVTEGAGIDGYVLKWDNATSMWIASATSGGFSGAYSDLTGKPTLFSGSYTDLTSKPTIPTTLNDLTDVNVTEGSGINGYSLTWDNATSKWVATNVSSGGGGGATALSGLSDVTLTSPSSGQVLHYNGSGWVNYSLGLATVATTGAYSDLSGKPSLATVATSGSYADLSSKPANSSWNLASLGDVSVTTGSGVDGYCLYWNNGASKFELKSVSGGGTSLAGLTTDVAITSPASGQLIVFNSGTGKWTNQAPPTVGFMVGTPPSVVQFASATANGSDAAVTMGSAPVSGNLLIAVVYSDSTTPGTASGWTLWASTSSGQWYQYVFSKVAGGSESASQNPVGSGGGGHWTKGIWEVTNQAASNPIVVANASMNSVASSIAQAATLPQSASTLYLASIVPASNQTYTITKVFGIATTDANLTSAAGAHAAFGHSDSNNPTYGMLGSCSTQCQTNSAFVLITH